MRSVKNNVLIPWSRVSLELTVSIKVLYLVEAMVQRKIHYEPPGLARLEPYLLSGPVFMQIKEPK